jgi:hypothetical protein
LIFEEEIKDPKGLFEKLGKFLSVEPSGFKVPKDKINASDFPRCRGLFLVGKKFNLFLIKRDMNLLSKLLKKFTPLFEKKATKKKERAKPKIPKSILEKYQKDTKELEVLLGRDLPLWGN